MRAEDGRLAPRGGQRDVEADPGEEQERGGGVEKGEDLGALLEEGLAQGEDHEEVEQERREGQEAQLVQSVEGRVEAAHLAGRREDHEPGESEGQQVEEDVGQGHLSPRIEEDDEREGQGHQADEDEIIIDGIDGPLLGIEGGIDLHPFLADLVGDALVGRRGLPEALEDVDLRRDRDLVDRRQDVALAQARAQEGLALRIDPDGPQAAPGRLPGDAVRDVPPHRLAVDVRRSQGEDEQDGQEDEDVGSLHRHPKN